MNKHIVPPIPIRYENGDELIHTDSTPYCSDPLCPCYSEAPTIKSVTARLPHGSKPLRRLRLLKREKGDPQR